MILRDSKIIEMTVLVGTKCTKAGVKKRVKTGTGTVRGPGRPKKKAPAADPAILYHIYTMIIFISHLPSVADQKAALQSLQDMFASLRWQAIREYLRHLIEKDEPFPLQIPYPEQDEGPMEYWSRIVCKSSSQVERKRKTTHGFYQREKPWVLPNAAFKKEKIYRTEPLDNALFVVADFIINYNEGFYIDYNDVGKFGVRSWKPVAKMTKIRGFMGGYDRL